MNSDDFEQQLRAFRPETPPSDWRAEVLRPALAHVRAVTDGGPGRRSVGSGWAGWWTNPWTVLAGALGLVVWLHGGRAPDVQPAAVWAARPVRPVPDLMTAWRQYSEQLAAWSRYSWEEGGDGPAIPRSPLPVQPRGQWIPRIGPGRPHESAASETWLG